MKEIIENVKLVENATVGRTCPSVLFYGKSKRNTLLKCLRNWGVH